MSKYLPNFGTKLKQPRLPQTRLPWKDIDEYLSMHGNYYNDNNVHNNIDHNIDDDIHNNIDHNIDENIHNNIDHYILMIIFIIILIIILMMIFIII